MTERSVESYDPLAYYVNKVEELSREVVRAHKTKDSDKIKELLNQGDKVCYDVFICVNHSWHGFVLLVPWKEESVDEVHDMMYNDPYKIPGQLLCWKFELCFENARLRMYKISKKFKLFEEVQKSTKKFYYIGRYDGVPLKGMEFAALKAAPHRYEALLSDCVAFAMEYCMVLLSYCSNGLKIEKQVEDNIKKATATGFTVEKLSRQSYLSGWMGNFSLGGTDVTTFLGGQNNGGILLLLLLLLLFISFVWPIVVVVLAKRYYL